MNTDRNFARTLGELEGIALVGAISADLPDRDRVARLADKLMQMYIDATSDLGQFFDVPAQLDEDRPLSADPDEVAP